MNLRELEQAATPGPWLPEDVYADAYTIHSEDILFTAALRNAAPFLLDVVEAARATPDDRLIARIERINAALAALDSHLSAASEKERTTP